MTLTSVREKLHKYIDTADSKKVMAIYTILQSDFDINDNIYDDDAIKKLEQRKADFEIGGQKGYTVQESMEYVKNEMKRRAL